MKNSKPRIVVLGGGTGSFTLLTGLKKLTPNITALVNMADDGGSTGVLRDELGVLPPGDIRQCLVALSESPQVLRDLFNFRFPKDSSFAGHSLGNLFLSALEMMSDNFGDAVEIASEVLKITGQVIPITLTKVTLHMATQDGEVSGEHSVASTPLMHGEKVKLWLMPRAKLNPAAQKAIDSADMIVIAPGDLYGSLIPTLLVEGVADALQAAKAPVVYISNLVNKPRQTRDFRVLDYVNELERFIGAGCINTVIYNTDTPEPSLLDAYALDGEFPVIVDQEQFESASFEAVGRPLLSRDTHKRNSNDHFIHRSLIRHNPVLVAKALKEVLHDA